MLISAATRDSAATNRGVACRPPGKFHLRFGTLCVTIRKRRPRRTKRSHAPANPHRGGRLYEPLVPGGRRPAGRSGRHGLGRLHRHHRQRRPHQGPAADGQSNERLSRPDGAPPGGSAGPMGGFPGPMGAPPGGSAGPMGQPFGPGPMGAARRQRRPDGSAALPRRHALPRRQFPDGRNLPQSTRRFAGRSSHHGRRRRRSESVLQGPRSVLPARPTQSAAADPHPYHYE